MHPDRRSIRLKGHDYSQPGYYFITICTQNRRCQFGRMVNAAFVMNDVGQVVQQCWNDIPLHFPHMKLDVFVVMPNHIHGILLIVHRPADSMGTEQFGKPVPGSISTIIRSFKSAVTRHINNLRQTPGARLWQRNYWEHIVRNENELNRIREYIVRNPQNWEMDRLNGGDGNRIMEITEFYGIEPWMI